MGHDAVSYTHLDVYKRQPYRAYRAWLRPHTYRPQGCRPCARSSRPYAGRRRKMCIRDRSNDVARERAVRISALGALGDVDAGEQVDVLLDVGDCGAPHIGGNGMRALRTLGVVLDVAQDGHIGHAEHVGEMPNRDRIIRKVAVRRDGKRRTVIDDGHAIAVELSLIHIYGGP